MSSSAKLERRQQHHPAHGNHSNGCANLDKVTVR